LPTAPSPTTTNLTRVAPPASFFNNVLFLTKKLKNHKLFKNTKEYYTSATAAAGSSDASLSDFFDFVVVVVADGFASLDDDAFGLGTMIVVKIKKTNLEPQT
jgi:hypothetical protein